MPGYGAKKLVLVLEISASETEASKDANSEELERFEFQQVLEALKKSKLQQIFCAYYIAQFVKFSIEALINSSSKINII